MQIVTSSDISSFELIHSGLVNTLLLYLTATSDATTTSCTTPSTASKKDNANNMAESKDAHLPGKFGSKSSSADGRRSGAVSAQYANDETSAGIGLTSTSSATPADANAQSASDAGSSHNIGSSNVLLSSDSSALDPDVLVNIVKTARDERLRNFLHVFLGCSVGNSAISSP